MNTNDEGDDECLVIVILITREDKCRCSGVSRMLKAQSSSVCRMTVTRQGTEQTQSSRERDVSQETNASKKYEQISPCYVKIAEVLVKIKIACFIGGWTGRHRANDRQFIKTIR